MPAICTFWRQFDCLECVQQDGIYDPLRVHTSVPLRYHSITSASSIQPIGTNHISSHRFPRISQRDTRRSRYCIWYLTYFSITQYSTVYRYKSASVSVITHVYMQQDDARVAFRAPLPEAEDEASQGETTSVETPEGRLQRLDARESRRDRDREVNLRQNAL